MITGIGCVPANSHMADDQKQNHFLKIEGSSQERSPATRRFCLNRDSFLARQQRRDGRYDGAVTVRSGTPEMPRIEESIEGIEESGM